MLVQHAAQWGLDLGYGLLVLLKDNSLSDWEDCPGIGREANGSRVEEGRQHHRILVIWKLTDLRDLWKK